MEIKLLPCPFCGGNSEIYSAVTRIPNSDGSLQGHWVVDCTSCNASIEFNGSPKEAAKNWNDRSFVKPCVSNLEENKGQQNLITVNERQAALEDLEWIRLSRLSETTGKQFDEMKERFDRVKSALQSPRDNTYETDHLKNVLRDVLKAVCMQNNGVEDTIFVNGSPIGDFIMGELDEDIELDALQNAPYRCKQTSDLFFPRIPVIPGLDEAILNASITPSNIGDAKGRAILLEAARWVAELQKGK